MNKGNEAYDEHLNTLKERLGIKAYANELVENISTTFVKTNHIEMTQYITKAATYVMYAAGVCVVVYLGFSILRWLTTSDQIVQGAILSSKTVELAKNATENVKETQEIMVDLIKEIVPIINTAATSAVNIHDRGLVTAFKTFSEWAQHINKVIDEQNKTIINMASKVNTLEIINKKILEKYPITDATT